MYRKTKKLVLSAVLLLLLAAVAYNSLHLTGLFLATSDWQKYWENREVLEIDNSKEYITHFIKFGMYKPKVCSEGIWVTDGFNDIDFQTFNETYSNGYCVSTNIKFRNPIYTERKISIRPVTAPERPSRRVLITAKAIMNSMKVYVYYGRKPVIPEYNKLQDDPNFDVVIQNETLVNGTLIVTFYHTSETPRNISILGNVNYTLSENVSNGYEVVELKIYGWNEYGQNYFQLVVE